MRIKSVAVLALGALLVVGAPVRVPADARSTGTEQVLEAGFHLNDRVDMLVTATTTDDVGTGEAGLPERTTATQACVTLVLNKADAPDEVRQWCDSDAVLEMSPTLDTATLTGRIGGNDIEVEFTADSLPMLVTDGPTADTVAVGVSRTGFAHAEIIGDIFGEAEAQGSSWYAEVREKLKSTASGQ